MKDLFLAYKITHRREDPVAVYTNRDAFECDQEVYNHSHAHIITVENQIICLETEFVLVVYGIISNCPSSITIHNNWIGVQSQLIEIEERQGEGYWLKLPFFA